MSLEPNRFKTPLDLLSYPRGILLTIFGVFYTFLMTLFIPLVGVLTRSKYLVDRGVMYVWSRPLVVLGGVRVEVRGKEWVDVDAKSKGFLIVFNHTSLVDIPVLFAYFPRPFRFGAKIELFKIPFFGKAMKAIGILPIDRNSRNRVMRVYNAAVSRIANGECFALAPEGTRQNEQRLGRFKRGPFEFAINAHADIVPVIIYGALKVMPKHSAFVNMGRWRRKIILQMTPPVSSSEYTMDSVDDLQERVRQQMESALNSLRVLDEQT